MQGNQIRTVLKIHENNTNLVTYSSSTCTERDIGSFYVSLTKHFLFATIQNLAV
jgi:hypothetical protein